MGYNEDINCLLPSKSLTERMTEDSVAANERALLLDIADALEKSRRSLTFINKEAKRTGTISSMGLKLINQAITGLAKTETNVRDSRSFVAGKSR